MQRRFALVKHAHGMDDLTGFSISGILDGETVVWDDTTGAFIPAPASAGVTDHGALTGLGDDDHTQYHNDTRGDARYYTQAQVTAGFQPLDSTLTAYAGGDTPSAFTLGVVDSVDAAAWRTAIGAGTSSFSGAYGDLSGAPSIPAAANPTASIGLTAVNGTAGTFLRSDGAPALDQGISPTWTGTHTFSNALLGPNGSNSAPAFSFSSDPDTGMYRSTTNVLNFATAGVSRFQIGAGGAAQFTASVQAMGYDLTAGSGVTNGMWLQSSGQIRFSAAGVQTLELLYTGGEHNALFSGFIRLPHGSAPSSPQNGDMWTTSSGLYVRINGSTIGPLS